MLGVLAILASGALVIAGVVAWASCGLTNTVRLGIKLPGLFAITHVFCESSFARTKRTNW